MILKLGFLLASIMLALAVCPDAWAQEETGRIRDVIYRKKQGVALTMDIFKPANPNGIGVIWMVSGGWYSNHDSLNPGLAKIFTDRGMTVFQVVHGSQPRFTLAEIVQDIHRAVRYIRTHAAEYGVDPNRLGAAGGSAGGHLSLMMAAYGGNGDVSQKDPIDRASSRIQAAAVFYPPTDFLNYSAEGIRALNHEMLRPYWHVFAVPPGASEMEKDAIARRLSPLYGVSANTPPVLIIHGDADKLVPIQQANLIIAKLAEMKVPHKLIVREGLAHGWPEQDKDVVIMADWFAERLGGSSPKP